MRKLAIPIIATILAMIGVLGWQGSASAHTGHGSADCNGIVLTGTNYESGHSNVWSISLDGSVVASGTFGTDLNETYPVPQDGAAHTWATHIAGYDGHYTFDDSGDVGPCGTPPPPPPCPGPCPVATNGHGPNLNCDSVVTGGTYKNVKVRKGDSCTLRGAQVNGNVNASGAKNVRILNTTVVKGVHIEGATGTVMIGVAGCKFDPLVGKDIHVLNSHNVAICQVTVCHDIRVMGNDGRITVRGNTARKIAVTNNRKYVPDSNKSKHNNSGLIRVFGNHAYSYNTRHNARKVAFWDNEVLTP